jgi:hypothetical protein
MKIKFLFSFFISFCFIAPGSGQVKCPVKKIYAYKQASLPGIQPRTVENGGKERNETFNYWIYLALPKNKSISIEHIWISGQKFSVKSEIIESSPITKINNSQVAGKETIELVPLTKLQVILIYPSGLINDNADLSAKARKKIEKNELVIYFTWKEKKRMVKKKLIKVLVAEPLP